jgi:EAL domain-containing protein (putative c-di-GMP-specific phosphodiesterase class I)
MGSSDLVVGWWLEAQPRTPDRFPIRTAAQTFATLRSRDDRRSTIPSRPRPRRRWRRASTGRIDMAPTTTSSLDAPRALDDGALVIDGLPGFFTLHYQPEFDLHRHRVAGCESLLRWWHPDFGMLRPGLSLHRTRWSPWVVRAEEWAVTAACRQAAVWRADGRPMPVALNVSRRLLVDPAFPHLVEAAIRESEADPADLAIDVPLSAFTKHRLDALPNLRTLHDLGATIVADGVAGNVGLVLEGTPVDVLKISLHRAGRRREGLHPSVGQALAVARELDAEAVGKAVERSGELEDLRTLGFDRAFGHVFSPALEPAELIALVERTEREALR